MPKTIAVVDEKGNRYEATYPKRAKGLVKKGRARFVTEDIICLTCPPIKEQTEGTTMSQNMLSLDMILQQLKEIADNTDHILGALNAVATIPSGGAGNEPYSPGDIAGQAKAEAISVIVGQRETTNQQLIRLYERMYDDLMKRTDAIDNTK